MRPAQLCFAVSCAISFSALTNVGTAHAVSSPSAVQIDWITKTSARVRWTAGDAATDARIRFGLDSSLGGVIDFPKKGGTSFTDRGWYLSGLKPGQNYFVCVEEMDGSGTSPCNGTGSLLSFTTLPETSARPSDPEPPREQVDVSMPIQAGRTLLVDAKTCSGPNSSLQAQLDAARPGDTIVIPAGSVCTGVFRFPTKAGDGWIVVRTSTPDELLPPPGARVLPEDKRLLATLRNGGPTMANNVSPGYGCDLSGNLLWASNRNSVIPVLRCTDSGTYQPVAPVGRGMSVPTQCRSGDWFTQIDDKGQLLAPWWCVADNDYAPISIDNNGNTDLGAAVVFEANASHYRLIGLEISALPLPAGERGVVFPALVHMAVSNSYLTIDRCWLHGFEPPVGVGIGVLFLGHHLAIVDSYIEKIWVARPASDPGKQFSPHGILASLARGPARIENNYINAVGISFFTDGSFSDYPDPADFVVRHNYFYKSDRHRLGSPISDGWMYWNRHHFELKRGRRFAIEGNVFEGNFGVVNQGAMLEFTPRSGKDLVNPTNLMSISDILIRNNVIRDTPHGIDIMGHDDNVFPAPLMTELSRRFRIVNNVFYHLDGTLFTPIGNYVDGSFPSLLAVYKGGEDFVFEHNTAYDMRPSKVGHRPLIFFVGDGGYPGSGLSLRDNVVPFPPSSLALVEGGGTPTETLKLWTRWPDAGWFFDHNLSYGRMDMISAHPAGNFWTANDSALGWQTKDPWSLALSPSSVYAGKASDGTDPGADFAELRRATEHTIDGQWTGNRSKSSTEAVPRLHVKVRPNPWRSDRNRDNPKVTFDGLFGHTTLEIFTVSGHRVKTLSTSESLVTWDLTTSSGDRAASGLYLFTAKNESSSTRGKFAIIR